MATIDRRGVSVDQTDTPTAGDPNPGLAVKAPARVATTANITLHGLQTINGVALALGDRVLVWQQTDPRQNGIYNASTGTWQRSADFRSNDQITTGTLVFVTGGQVYTWSIWALTSPSPIDLGTDDITFELQQRTAGSNQLTFDTLADAEAAFIPAGTTCVHTLGRYFVGDNGGARYIPIGASSAAAWRFQSADGEWWTLNNRDVTPEMLGAAIGADTTAVWQSLTTWLNLFNTGGMRVSFTPGASYAIWPQGTSPTVLLRPVGIRGLTIDFNGAKFTTNNLFVPQGSPYIIVPTACTNLTINNPTYEQTAFTTLSFTKGAYLIYLGDDQGAGNFCTNVIVNNGVMNGGVAYFVAVSTSSGADAAKNVTLNNARTDGVYYGINTSGSPDGLVATGIHCTNAGRAYFPSNCSNHEVEVLGTGGDVHDWVLLNVYAQPGKSAGRNTLSNIDLTIRSRGQASIGACRSLVDLCIQQIVAPMTISAVADNGSGKARLTVNTTANLSAGTTLLHFAGLGGWTTINGTKQTATKINATTLDLLDVAYPGGYTSGGSISIPAAVRGIKIHYDVDNSNGNRNPPALVTFKSDHNGAADTTTRGYTVSGLELSGFLGGYDFGDVLADIFNNTGGLLSYGLWDGEDISGVHVHDLEVSGIAGTISINATGMSPFLSMENVVGPAGIVWTVTDPNGVLRTNNVSVNGIEDRRSAKVTAATSNQFLVSFNADGSFTKLQATVAGLGGAGTGVLAALALNIGSAGALVTFNGAGGTPSSITLTNASGTAPSLTAGTATNAVNSAITNDSTTNATVYPVWVTANTGNLPHKVTSSKFVMNPAAGTFGIGTVAAPTASLFSVFGSPTGSVQLAMDFEPTFSSSATGSGTGLYIAPSTAAAAYAMTNMIALRLANGTLGAGSSVTTEYKIYIDAPSFPISSASRYSIFSAGGRNRLTELAIGTDVEAGTGNLAVSGSVVVTGTMARKKANRTVVNGLNSDIATPASSSIRLTGPTGAFSIGGFTGGTDGQLLDVFNAVAQTMTIVNEDASSTAGNRILTLTGGNLALRATAISFARFQYDATNTRWLLVSYN